jgi:hypothetical protein
MFRDRKRSSMRVSTIRLTYRLTDGANQMVIFTVATRDGATPLVTASLVLELECVIGLIELECHRLIRDNPRDRGQWRQGSCELR